MNIETAIKKFIEYLTKELNYSLNTQESYQRDLLLYQNFLNDHNYS